MRQPLAQRRAPTQQISRIVSMQAPTGGWNARDALANMKPGEAIYMRNWYPRATDIVGRGGQEDFVSDVPGTTETLAVYNSLTGTSKMFAATSSGIYDASTAGSLTANYLNLPGASGDYASTPDSAALDITGDIEFIVYAAADDWTPSAAQAFLGKLVTTGNQVSYDFVLNSNGTLLIVTSPTGNAAANVSGTSTASVSATNGSGIWLRGTLDVNDGSGNRVYTFYTSTDPVSTPVASITWTQLGSTVTTAGTTSIFASTSALEIGSIQGGTLNNFDGKIYKAIVYNGLGGTLVASFDASDALPGASTVVSSQTGETYTLNGSASIIGSVVLTRTNGRHQCTMFGDGTNNYLIMCNGVDAPAYYNGTSWLAVTAATTPALTGLTTTSIIGVFVHQKRLWFIEKNSLSAWYLAAGAAGGALTEFDLSSIATRGGYLVAGGTWSVDSGNGPTDRWVAVTSEGEIIVYQGVNPASASDWLLIGVYYIGEPLGRRCLVKVGGDLVVITQIGAYPLSAVLQSATVDRRLAVTNKVEQAFNEASRQYSANHGWEAIFYPAQSALLFNIPTVEGSEAKQYVLNTSAPKKPWCEFNSWNATCFALYNGELFYGMNGAVQKAWVSTKSDDGENIVMELKEAFQKYGSDEQKRANLYRPILRVNGSVSYLTGIDVDFKDTAITGEATYSVTSGARWDVSDWDESYWAANLDVVRQWSSPQENVGTWFAGKLKIATNSLDIEMIASDIMFERGGGI